MIKNTCKFCRKEFENKIKRDFCSHSCSSLSRSHKSIEAYLEIENKIFELLYNGESALSVMRKLNVRACSVNRIIKERFGNIRPVDAICKELWNQGLNEKEISEKLHISIGGIVPIIKRSVLNYQRRYEFADDLNTKRINLIKQESRNRLALMLMLYRKHKTIKGVAEEMGANLSVVSRKLGTSKIYKKIIRKRSFSEHWSKKSTRQLMFSKKYPDENKIFIPLVFEKIKLSGIASKIKIEYNIGDGTSGRKGRKRRCDIFAIINGIKIVIQCKCDSAATKEDMVIGQVIVAKSLIKNSVPVICFPSDCIHSDDYKKVIKDLGIIDVTEETIVEILRKAFL